MELLRVLEEGQERKRKPGVFWVSDACECPRKVLYAVRGEEKGKKPRRMFYRMIAGLGAEKALLDLLPKLDATNSQHIVEALPDYLSAEDLEYALGKGLAGNIGKSFIYQFPFRRVRDGLEVHGKVDFLALFRDELFVLEVKQTHFQGEREVIRKGKIFPSFLAQLSFYSEELGIPGKLLVFTVNGEAREFEFRGGKVEGRELRIGGLPPHEFVWRRLSFLREAKPEDFPIRREGQIFTLSLPEGFPSHEEDTYSLVVNRKGRPTGEAKAKGKTLKSSRCHICDYRLLCFPDLPWKEEG
jgi:CRISPR/Cas system-associated exonuclease Cas4 (RecB family)